MLIKASKQFYNAGKYSLAGFQFMIRSELAARMELFGFLFFMALYGILGAKPIHFIIAGVLMFLLLAVEAMNTAIEVIIDRVSPEISETGKRAKDLGSFAVMCMLFVNGIHMCYVISQVTEPKIGNTILACTIIVFFIFAAIFTKFHRHNPRGEEG